MFLAAITASAQDNKRKPHFSPEEFQAKQRAYITEKAELTTEEADAFFPLFFELQKKKFELERNARKDFKRQRGEKMTKEQLEQVEDMVNEQINRALPIVCETMTIEEAKAAGVTALFTAKYGEQVKVYTMGDFSKEVCGGPHAENTAELVAFKIQKEESSSAGVRRIKAIIGQPAADKRKAAGK